MHAHTLFALAAVLAVAGGALAQHCTDPKSACATAAGGSTNGTAGNEEVCALTGPAKQRVWVPEGWCWCVGE
jgi:hypothetical protein